MLSNLFDKTVDRLGEWNPQLGRELKGRLKPLNIAIAGGISILVQWITVGNYYSQLPVQELSSRYCDGPPPTDSSEYATYYNTCTTDMLGNVKILETLWWLDLFIALSCVGIFALLLLGTFTLISDLDKEKNKGTLNFIRVTPQTATTVVGGKLLGVPILTHIGIALMAPLHLVAGLKASIPLHLILSFYLLVVASCIFFYSAALLYGLVTKGLGAFEPVIFTAGLFMYLMLSFSQLSYIDLQYNSFDWFKIINPAVILPYLVKSTFLSPNAIGYMNWEDLSELTWYGLPLWNRDLGVISLTLCNYGIWSYWFWQGIKRRYHNPTCTPLSKPHSYWITGCFVAINLGFALQTNEYSFPGENFSLMLGFNTVLFLMLIGALTTPRQGLQDWARHRHQSTTKMNLWQDLLWGEHSPSVMALTINLLIMSLYLVPAILFLEWHDSKGAILVSLLIVSNIILLYGAVAQLLLFMKSDKRVLFLSGTITALIILPLVGAAIVPAKASFLFLFSIIPTQGIMGGGLYSIITAVSLQWLGIVLANGQVVRLLKSAGDSSTKVLLSSTQ